MRTRRALNAVAVAAATGIVAATASAAGTEVLVKAAPDSTAQERDGLTRALRAVRIRQLPADWRAYTLPPGLGIAHARASLRNRAGHLRIEEATPIERFAVSPGTAPSPSWHLARIGAPAAWGAARGPVTVAVSDTGVDTTHPFLDGQIWRNPGELLNGRDDDGNGLVDDIAGWDLLHDDATVFDSATGDGHGTHVAATIAGINAPADALGVAPNARIMVTKFMDGDTPTTTASAIASLDYASRAGARVINVSWGTRVYSQALCDAVSVAVARGSLIVAAAGNDGLDESEGSIYPAACASPGIISVTATDRDDRLASFANRGRVTVDLAAPGVDIVAGVPGGGFGARTGTSMAAPQVTGAAALLLGQDPSLTPAEVKARLMDAGTALPDLARTTVSGRRLRVVTMGQSEPADATTPPPAGGPSKPSASDPTPPAETTPSFGITRPRDAEHVRHLVLDWSSPTPPARIAHYRVLLDEIEVERVPAHRFRFESSTVPQGPHFVRVAGDLVGGGTISTSPIAVFVDRTPPTAPDLVALANHGDRTVRLVWTAATDDGGIDHYVVRWPTGSLRLPADRLALPFALSVERPMPVRLSAVDTAGNVRTVRRIVRPRPDTAKDSRGFLAGPAVTSYGVCPASRPGCLQIPGG